ncbi:MAG: acylphosphatase [Candidatus Obscuribacterales bacterium]|nr:acylphosphatase [Candidatus Obscuribacterales bacterium]
MQVLAKLKIHGRVQGVFFRQSTREKARELGLSGWVKNMPDGTVEALATGPENVVNELIAWCQHGPAYARVEKVDAVVTMVEDSHPEPVPSGPFQIA